MIRMVVRFNLNRQATCKPANGPANAAPAFRRSFICDPKLAALGWQERTAWEAGLQQTISWYNRFVGRDGGGYWDKGEGRSGGGRGREEELPSAGGALADDPSSRLQQADALLVSLLQHMLRQLWSRTPTQLPLPRLEARSRQSSRSAQTGYSCGFGVQLVYRGGSCSAILLIFVWVHGRVGDVKAEHTRISKEGLNQQQQNPHRNKRQYKWAAAQWHGSHPRHHPLPVSHQPASQLVNQSLSPRRWSTAACVAAGPCRRACCGPAAAPPHHRSLPPSAEGAAAQPPPSAASSQPAGV